MTTLMSFNFYNTGSYWYNNSWSIDVAPNSAKSWGICDGKTLPFLQWQQWQWNACNPTDPCDELHAGTVDDPYLICTVQDLLGFATYVNSGSVTIGKYWRMMNDLDLVGINNWDPIGNGYSFQGYFDGNSKVISNLTINKGSTNYIGLFGRISNAEIKNLGIDTCQITGNQYVGALVGYVLGISTIENCHVTNGSISGYGYVGGLIGYEDYYSNLTIKNCYATGNVTGTGNVVGGVVGGLISTTMSSISNSYAICDVSGVNGVGGLVGIGFFSIIDKCYAGGNVQSTGLNIGGLVGYLTNGNFDITDCYVTGNVIATGASNSWIGGLAGWTSISNKIINCFVTGNITVTGATNDEIGGLVGNIQNNITNCYTTGNITVTGSSNSSIGGLIGHNYGSITHCYAIENITATGGLSSDIGGLVSSDYGSITCCYATSDITVTGSSNFNIGGLVGSTIFTSANITSCYATGNIFTGSSNFNIGGLVGNNTFPHNDNNITDCYAAVNIVTGVSNSNIGGLAGNNSHPITYCYATGNISGIGGTSFGGLVGYNSGNIRNCVAANAIVAGATSDIHRVVGTAYYGTLSNNYAYDGMVITPIGSGNGGTLKDMLTLKSFSFYNMGSNWYNNTPWDIAVGQNSSKTWGICNDDTLPLLQCHEFICGKKLPYEEDYPVEQNEKSAFFIFPNPTDGQLTIKMSDVRYETCDITIFDVFGRTVTTLSFGGGRGEVDVSHLPVGIYFIRMITETGVEVQKFIKK